MPRSTDLKKVMVIGSGPIVIGQAAEFDYAGTQACQALREEGVEVVLLNSNPATIMTDRSIADRTYIEPLTLSTAERIIELERPDGLLPTLGGQVGLNLAVQLAESGVLKRYGVRLLGASVEAIRKSEDRELFKQTMGELGQPVPESAIIHSGDDALEFAREVGFPLIVRPAYTLGGSGGGVAYNEAELREVVERGLHASPIGQVLLERSLLGWKEIEFEVVRDHRNHCVAVCSMENFDPVGIHTGDSIVAAPAQTLTDHQLNLLRAASLKIIRGLGIEGGCNVQLALDPHSDRYYVIEVNPRVSRSSALASKATGYPIAKIAAKIALGISLDEMKSSTNGASLAEFEPRLDYVVVKIPRWPFDKFVTADRKLGTQMKATGEVMAIGSNVESALLKAVRSLETGHVGLWDEAMSKQSTEQLLAALPHADDLRLFNIAETLRRGVSIEKVHELTGIQPYFLQALHNIIEVEEEVRRGGLRPDIILKAKQIGLSDATIARLAGTTESYVRRSRQQAGIVPVYRKVDTCAPFFKEAAPYYYSSYHGESEAHSTGKSKVIVLGSGPIRIGQGIEFDYSSVHAVQALQKLGYEAIIVNNNPETVSTDFDTADRLYFEPLTLEDVLDIIEQEQPYGVICQFGGQTAINLAAPLANAGVYVLGTTVADMDRAEDRDKFDQVLASVNIPRPAGQAVTTPTEAIALAERIGYPVVVRPSYVLGGRAMEIVHNDRELTHYLATAVQVSPMHPVWIDRYLNGMEIEVDAVSDGTTVVIPGIMEHIERAGVHSGDSVAVYPPLHADTDVLRRVVEYTEQLARSLRIVGMCNIQFVVHDGEIYVLEVNPRASRTVPILTKATGVPLVQLATQAILGRSLSELGFSSGLVDDSGIVAVKIPIFSWGKLTDVDAVLGPEMKSTGEVMGIARDFASAMAKGMLAAGMDLPQGGGVLMTIADRDKEEATSLASQLAGMGYRLYATRGTARHLQREGITVETVDKLNEGQPNLLDLMNNGQVHLIINTYTRGKEPERDGFRIRRYAVERGIPCLTSLDTARAIIQVIASGGAIHRNPLVLHEAVPDRSRKENEV